MFPTDPTLAALRTEYLLQQQRMRQAAISAWHLAELTDSQVRFDLGAGDAREITPGSLVRRLQTRTAGRRRARTSSRAERRRRRG